LDHPGGDSPSSNAFHSLPSPASASELEREGLGAGTFFQEGYDKEIGFSYVITTGNGADFDVSDFLEYLLEDPGTDVICLAIDGLKKPKKFLKRLDYAREKKPVIILKMGGSRLGSKAALSHTGAITDSEMVFNAAMRQHGALVVDDFEDLLELASLLQKCHRPNGNSVAVITTSGGLGTYLSDLCEEFKLNLPEIEGSNLELKLLNIEGLLSFGAFRNPGILST